MKITMSAASSFDSKRVTCLQSYFCQAFVSIPINDLFPVPNGSRTHSLLVFDATHTPALPLPLKLGDANLDGFPDILLLLQVGGSTDQVPKLLFNTPCMKGVVGCGRDGNGRRGWREVGKKGGEALGNVRDARGVAFLDMDEDVRHFGDFCFSRCSISG